MTLYGANIIVRKMCVRSSSIFARAHSITSLLIYSAAPGQAKPWFADY
jgi:hypothetical protein